MIERQSIDWRKPIWYLNYLFIYWTVSKLIRVKHQITDSSILLNYWQHISNQSTYELYIIIMLITLYSLMFYVVNNKPNAASSKWLGLVSILTNVEEIFMTETLVWLCTQQWHMGEYYGLWRPCSQMLYCTAEWFVVSPQRPCLARSSPIHWRTSLEVHFVHQEYNIYSWSKNLHSVMIKVDVYMENKPEWCSIPGGDFSALLSTTSADPCTCATYCISITSNVCEARTLSSRGGKANLSTVITCSGAPLSLQDNLLITDASISWQLRSNDSLASYWQVDIGNLSVVLLELTCCPAIQKI